MAELKIQIPEKIGKIFAEPSVRYRVAYGGRGSAKSISFGRMLILEALQEPGKYLCCRELQKSIKTSVHSLLVAEINKMGLSAYFDIGKEYLRTADGGSEFLFFGLRSNAEEIKSTHGIRICWVEEAQAVSQFSWDMLIPTIRENGSEIWATFNPQDELDPIYVMSVISPREKMAVAEVNYDDNPWFPQVLEDERQECLRTSPEKYDWIWRGKLYVNVNSSVYGKWMEKAKDAGRIKSGIYDPSLPVFTGWDLGYSDDTAIWWFQVAGNELRAIDYYENCREDMKHYAEQIYGRHIIDVEYGENGKVLSYKLGNPIEGAEHRASYSYGDNYVPHDAANKLLQAGGRSVVDQLHEFGIKSRIVGATSQQNQISAGRAAIDLAWFDSERCSAGIRCLKKYEFEERDGDRGYSTTPKHDVYSHGCFVGSSEVLTRLGICAIDELPETGEVLTKCGWKPYINPHVTRTNAPLVMVKFKGGHSVKCTPDHLFLTESGWKSAESLAPNTVIQSTLMKSPNILMGGFIKCGLAKDTLRGVVRGFIGMFGRPLSVKYRKIATSTTKMETRSTIKLKTWSACNQTSTCDLHGKKQAGKNHSLDSRRTLEKKPLTGTGLMRAGCGINIIQILRVCSIVLKKYVRSAVFHIRGYIGPKEKQINDSAHHSAKRLLIKSVTRLEERQDVWCLTVPDVGHFSLSNGAVVKNCDAWEVVARIWKSAKMVQPPPKARYLQDMTAAEIFDLGGNTFREEGRI